MTQVQWNSAIRHLCMVTERVAKKTPTYRSKLNSITYAQIIKLEVRLISFPEKHFDFPQELRKKGDNQII